MRRMKYGREYLTIGMMSDNKGKTDAGEENDSGILKIDLM